MSQTSLDMRTFLYVDTLQTQSLYDRSLEEAILDIILANILAEPSNRDAIAQDDSRYACFQKSELLMFGTPVRHHLNPSTRQRLVEEINDILTWIRDFIHGDQVYGSESFCTLGEEIEALKDGIQLKQEEINEQLQKIINQILEISKIREEFERELKQGISVTLPIYDAWRCASIDLVIARIETTLIKLSLIRARSERALYHHKPKKNKVDDVSQALAVAFQTLKREEREMKTEILSLDEELDEYERMLELVDGGESMGGYQQVVNDWTKVKQETDECKRDLRRLGWTTSD